ncbi:hypothetical protein LX32DRAFT_321418 [Colletotrichum zoysiae]|uniref:Secreted protein n=1 Tax=Colletotrichum zoysiae TaxID=1216348 RepID=A0AAD9HM44_9PEZI|nr:hypothetical protein LX32DRAFT_321418 [Colletotrichum zoysiae]
MLQSKRRLGCILASWILFTQVLPDGSRQAMWIGPLSGEGSSTRPLRDENVFGVGSSLTNRRSNTGRKDELASDPEGLGKATAPSSEIKRCCCIPEVDNRIPTRGHRIAPHWPHTSTLGG